MEEPPDCKLHYDRYFRINCSKDGKLGYIRNYQSIDEQLAKCGFFLIGEIDFKKTTAQILEIYRRRDMVEKSFDQLKNELDMKRLRCHNADTAEGKVFVAFVALIVRAYMMNKLTALMRQNGYPFRKIQLELDKMTALSVTPRAKPCLTNPLTKPQRTIFEHLEVTLPGEPVCNNSGGV